MAMKFTMPEFCIPDNQYFPKWEQGHCQLHGNAVRQFKKLENLQCKIQMNVFQNLF